MAVVAAPVVFDGFLVEFNILLDVLFFFGLVADTLTVTSGSPSITDDEVPLLEVEVEDLGYCECCGPCSLNLSFNFLLVDRKRILIGIPWYPNSSRRLFYEVNKRRR